MKNKYIRVAVIILPILLSIICLVQMVRSNNQATLPIPKECIFSGEYSYDGENWYPYGESSDLSALEGDVVIKGHLDSEIFEGGMLNIFCNHIGVSIYVNGERIYIDTPSEIKDYGIDLMASMCGKRWEQTLCPSITTEDEVEFRFINYHNHGNNNAYKEAMSSLLITPPDNTILEGYLKYYVRPYEMMGYALLIVAVMLLGAALSALVFKSNMTNTLFKIGCATLFVGGYMIFDVMTAFFMGELLVVKTYGQQLSLMLSVYFLGLMLCDRLTDTYKKIAEIIMGSSSIINMFIIVLATIGEVLLYDTLFWWKLAQGIISSMLIVLCILELNKVKVLKKELFIYIGVNMALLTDMTSVSYGRYNSGIFFKVAYVGMLILFMIYGLKQVLIDHQASIKNKKLKEELSNSRIALMLSQIQPHFIYNTLGTIGELCEEEPKKAADLVRKFSLYLRGNFTELDNPRPIPVSQELEHVKHYADIEQIRFPDMEVEYEIESDNFLVPALTIQPLVENAIKHGLMGLESGGTIKISCYESDNYYEVCVKDNGVGFEDSVFTDGKKHIGIKNIRKRLEGMCEGTLTIDSTIGKGTTAVIRIPKEGVECDSTSGR